MERRKVRVLRGEKRVGDGGGRGEKGEKGSGQEGMGRKKGRRR